MRKNYSGKFKAKVVVEVIKEQDTIAELASKYEVHRSLLTRWKKEALCLSKPEIFNTDQGSQYTSLKFLSVLKEGEICIKPWGTSHRHPFIEPLDEEPYASGGPTGYYSALRRVDFTL